MFFNPIKLFSNMLLYLRNIFNLLQQCKTTEIETTHPQLVKLKEAKELFVNEIRNCGVIESEPDKPLVIKNYSADMLFKHFKKGILETDCTTEERLHKASEKIESIRTSFKNLRIKTGICSGNLEETFQSFYYNTDKDLKHILGTIFKSRDDFQKDKTYSIHKILGKSLFDIKKSAENLRKHIKNKSVFFLNDSEYKKVFESINYLIDTNFNPKNLEFSNLFEIYSRFDCIFVWWDKNFQSIFKEIDKAVKSLKVETEKLLIIIRFYIFLIEPLKDEFEKLIKTINFYINSIKESLTILESSIFSLSLKTENIDKESLKYALKEVCGFLFKDYENLNNFEDKDLIENFKINVEELVIEKEETIYETQPDVETKTFFAEKVDKKDGDFLILKNMFRGYKFADFENIETILLFITTVFLFTAFMVFLGKLSRY